ncbi:alkaline phosphatase [Siphonobacter sp. BAB-5405]|uniref:alkaline phosphatase n=1 Tax=Siphonobacter sp. BAB-5405 TaxID=1864825 RepID=UPI000C8049CC|nr:alkaline phosphatase [Siphonobacter sp. BAB-5405]PMD97549.1 alkaline phosphatase [Siphonobacter sp. BAB-5405]
MHRYLLLCAGLLAGCLSVQAQQTPKRPKNVILLIGDGMGVNQVYAAQIANKGPLHLNRFPYLGLSTTHPVKDFITDSGAGGTALSTGVKTKNGAVAVDSANRPQVTLAELAKKRKLSTGIVTTCDITDATPADFYAHQASRSQHEAIAEQMVNADLDVVIGGGMRYFFQRKDGKNLLEDFKKKGYTVADTSQDFTAATGKKLVAFNAGMNPIKVKEGRGPILRQEVEKALSILSENKNGFFLMAEGSQIDWAGHANDMEYMVTETLDFDKAVGAALDFAEKNGETLVIVTADHETGGLSLTGGDWRNGVVEGKFIWMNHSANPVPVFAYGPGSEIFRGIFPNVEVNKKIQQAWWGETILSRK